MELTLILLRGALDIALECLLLLLLKALVVACSIVGAGGRPGFSSLLDRWFLWLLAGYIIVLSQNSIGIGGVGRYGVLLLPIKADIWKFSRLLVERDEVLDQGAALVKDLVKLVVLCDSRGLLLLEQVLDVR